MRHCTLTACSSVRKAAGKVRITADTLHLGQLVDLRELLRILAAVEEGQDLAFDEVLFGVCQGR